MRAAALVLAFGAALAALVLAGTASAQSPLQPTIDLNVTWPEAPLVPFVEAEGFPALAEVEVVVPARITYTVPAGAVVLGPGQIVLQPVQAPFWLAVPLPAPIDVPLEPGIVQETRTFVYATNVTMYAKATAPGGRSGEDVVVLAATAGRNGFLADATDAAEGRVAAEGYVLLVVHEVVNLTPELERYGEGVTVVRVLNRGNVHVATTVKVAHADPGLEVEGPAFPAFLRPNPLGVEAEEEARPLEVTIRHRSGPGGEVLLHVAPAVAPEARLVQERVVHVHVEVLGGAGDLGALPFVLLGAALAGAVFLRRS